MKRELFLHESVGEARGVVLVDGRPERLIVLRDDEPAELRLGARLRARVRRVEAQIALAFLDLGGGREAMLDFRPDARPVEGSTLEVEIRAEPRRGKLAVVRPLGPAEGAPGLIAPPPSLAEQLRAIAPDVVIIRGRRACEAADEAEAEALEIEHRLEGGGSIAVETTRALTSIDVDVGDRQGQTAKRVTRQANLTALRTGARLLRLKGQGGIVVFDLAGRGHDGPALLAAARAAFSPDNPGVVIGPISRFGLLELSLTRRGRPLAEILCEPTGRPTPRTAAQRLIRRLESEAGAHPGARLAAACAPDVAPEFEPLLARLVERIGARATVSVDPGVRREDLRVELR